MRFLGCHCLQPRLLTRSLRTMSTIHHPLAITKPRTRASSPFPPANKKQEQCSTKFCCYKKTTLSIKITMYQYMILARKRKMSILLYCFCHSGASWCRSRCCCCSVTQLCPTLCDPMDCQASLSFTISRSLLKLIPIELVMTSNHLILCYPLLLLSLPFL